MRLKIFFFPIALAVSIVLFIWLINPEFSQLKGDKSELDSQKNILREIKVKKQNVNNLNANLDGNSDKEKLVLEYFPSVEKEEEIINMLNYSATSSGIALLDFNADIVKDSSKSFKAAEAEENKAPEVMVRKTKVKLSLAGSYENIKSFFDRIYKIKRANDISMVNIFSQPESEKLLAEAEICFSYLPQTHLSLGDELSDPIFSQKSFNFTVADKVAELTSENNVSKLEANLAGRSNPFIP
ncbi:hypothetical protein J7J13_02480 [bacterium]|nr:hypothetical protein [bacterium]